VAFKPNLAFYEARGGQGWLSLQRTIKYIRSRESSVFILADAKRGDIGNTSDLYAKAFFESLDVDAVTLSPYMGRDTVLPFLHYENKWAVLLALTSNSGASDFQFSKDCEGHFLFEKVLETSKAWASPSQMMYVVGATKAEYLKRVRAIVPDHFLLVPGIGAQGGSLEEVALYGMNTHCGLLVNSSRGIIYAGSGVHFAEAAADQAAGLQHQMESLLKKYQLI
jgi:orotidine-5'-phosphate decarboxylase